MTGGPDILCIGAAHWDLIGCSDGPVGPGADVPGRIERRPGGVAMNIAMALARSGMRPALLSAIGRDPEGGDLIEAAQTHGLTTDYVYRDAGLPTDRYMAIEDPGGLIAAVADSRSLEAAGDRVLAPLSDGRLGSEAAPYPGRVALDGSLPTALLDRILTGPLLVAADLRCTATSPAKADRLRALLDRPGATLYLNREEAGILGKATFDSAPEAAQALSARASARILVTDRDRPMAEAGPNGLITATPPTVTVTGVTGAGDTFMAAHVAAEARGARPDAALRSALAAAAAHISRKVPA